MTAIEVAVPARRLDWQVAEVREIVPETPGVKSIRLDVPGWPGHLPGQHVDILLTAEDGYQAERSYSIASPPEDELLTLTVEQMENGEVSPYLVDDLRPGDRFELRGPIGGYFVWSAQIGGPLCLIAGGSGIAPLMAMLRHRHRQAGRPPAVLLYSSRTAETIIFRDELARLSAEDESLNVVHTLTREQSPSWRRFRRRVDRAMLAEVCFPPEARPKIYVCGPTGFVETAAGLLVELGHEPAAIRTERFGPTGG